MAFLAVSGCSGTGPCTESGDCSSSEVCHEGVCRTRCFDHYDCAVDQHCSHGACVPGAVSGGDGVAGDGVAGDDGVAGGDGVAGDPPSGDAGDGDVVAGDPANCTGGLPCDDDDLCTWGDECVAGVCTGAPIVCATQGCTIYECDGTDTCASRANEGAECNDEDDCTHTDRCDSSSECHGTDVVCVSDLCATRTCDGDEVCSVQLHNGVTCNDDDACTHGDECLAGACAGARTPNYLYWVDATDLHRVRRDGCDPELVQAGVGALSGVVIGANGVAYLSDRGTCPPGTDGAIRTLDGPGTLADLKTGLTCPNKIAIDSGLLYWTVTGEPSPRGVARGATTGAGSAMIITDGGGTSPRAIGVGGGKVYWADAGVDHIRRTNLDGSGGAEDIVTNAGTAPSALAVDVVNSKVYWGDDASNTIRWADLDGSNPTTIISSRVGIIHDMVVDPAGALYWSENNHIYWAALDGSVPEILLNGVGATVLALD